MKAVNVAADCCNLDLTLVLESPGFRVVSGSILIDFSLTVKAVTLIFISGCGSDSSLAKQEKSGSVYNLVKY